MAVSCGSSVNWGDILLSCAGTSSCWGVAGDILSLEAGLWAPDPGRPDPGLEPAEGGLLADDGRAAEPDLPSDGGLLVADGGCCVPEGGLWVAEGGRWVPDAGLSAAGAGDAAS